MNDGSATDADALDACREVFELAKEEPLVIGFPMVAHACMRLADAGSEESEIWVILMASLTHLKEWGKALEYAERAAEILPEEATVRTFIALAYAHAGKPEKAFEHALKAQSLSSGYKEWMTLAAVFRILENDDHYIQTIEKALTCEDATDDDFYHYAVWCETTERTDKADELYSEIKQRLALEYNPEEIETIFQETLKLFRRAPQPDADDCEAGAAPACGI
jgi:tetratricopeptide (TPR) repeat protein